MEKKNQFSQLFSWVGVIVILLIIVVVNVLFGLFRTRVDLTDDKLYTLSEGTVNILKNLDTPVDIRYYRTEDKEVLPEPVEVYIKRVEDILNEYQKRSGGKLRVEKLDPEPDSDAEVAALQDGISKASINVVEAFYNGIVVQCLDEKVVLPYLDGQQETLLEYELSRAVAEVTRSKKPKVAIMTDLAINGGGGMPNPMNPMAGGGQTPPWFLPKLLERDYDVETIPLSTEEIADDVDLLMLVHPTALSERSEYAIDQYVLKGGKMIAFVDPKFYWGQSGQPPQFGGPPPNDSSTLNKLFTAWGVTFTNSQVVADRKFGTQLSDQSGRQIDEPRVLSLNTDAINDDVPATGSLQNMLMWEAGAFTGTPAPGLEKVSLIHVSEGSQLVTPSQMMGNDSEQILANFKPEGKEYDLAVMLTGKFKTAFADGQPAAAADGEDDEDEDEDKEDKKDEDKKDSLKESESENTVVLVGDVDIINDQTFLRQFRDPFSGRVGQRMINTNMVLVQNLLEQMAGNENLIKIRSRTAAQRSFTKLREMDQKNEELYQEEIKKLQDRIDEAQRKLAEVESKKTEGDANAASPFTIDPESQEARKEIYKILAQAKEEFRQVQLRKREDKESLTNRLKAMNILGMPILVILLGIVLAFIRKSKTAAK